MMTRLFPLVLSLLLIFPSSAAWLTNLDTAKSQASEKKLPIYLVFTSLKVSGACVQLKKQALDSAPFQALLHDRFILVHLDIPAQKTPGMEDPLVRNIITAESFAVSAYPSTFLLNSQGQAFAKQTGTLLAPPEEMAERLFSLADRYLEREKNLAASYQKEGLARAQALVTTLTEFPILNSATIDSPHLEALAKLDPDDSLNFQKSHRAEEGFKALETEISSVFHRDSYQKVIQKVDTYLAEFTPEGTLRQKALFPKLAALNHSREKDKAIAVATEIIEIDPDSAHGKFAAQIRSRLESQ